MNPQNFKLTSKPATETFLVKDAIRREPSREGYLDLLLLESSSIRGSISHLQLIERSLLFGRGFDSDL